MSTGYINIPIPGTGTVTSVGLTVPSIFSISGSPITTSGTLGLTLNSVSANAVLAGPSSGASTTPTFRTLALQDIPSNATGRIIYVSGDSGNDTTGTGSFNNPYATIQKGINVAEAIPSTANTPIVVSVAPQASGAGYAENLSITQQGIILVNQASTGGRTDAAIIAGNITINLTGTAGGGNFVASLNNCYIIGFIIAPSTGVPVTFSGSTYQRLFISDCLIGQTSTSSAIVHSNSGSSSGSLSTITVRDCDFENNSGSNATISHTAGNLFITGANPNVTNSTTGGPAIASSGNSFTLNNGTVTGTITNSGSGSITISYSAITSSLSGAVVANTSTGGITIAGSSLTNTTSTGSGISNAGGTVTAIQNLFNIGTGTGAYVIKGTGVYLNSLNIFVSNAKYQNVLTFVALSSTPIPAV